MIDVIHRPKKRIFLALILTSLLIASISTYGIWKVSFPGLFSISANLPILLGALLAAVLLAVLTGVAGIILAIMGWPTFSFCRRPAWAAIQFLFPLAIQIGRLLDVDKERIERSFIEVSNQLVRRTAVATPADRLLVITPHCLQNEDCPYKITRNISNCRQCGRCQIGALAAMSDRYGFHFAVVTGGTAARQVVLKTKPRAVIAIACERDLTSGIQDIYPMPVIGVLNERPFGPCCNTRVRLENVEEALRDLLIKDGR